MTFKLEVLDIIKNSPDGITAGEVAEKLGRNKASVAGWCSRLVMSDTIHVCGWRWAKSGRGSSIYKIGKRPKNMPEPLKPEERCIHITSSVTPTEHQQITMAAKQRGMQCAAFMREIVLKAVEAPNA